MWQQGAPPFHLLFSKTRFQSPPHIIDISFSCSSSLCFRYQVLWFYLIQILSTKWKINVIKDNDGRFLICTVVINQEKIVLTNYYGLNSDENKCATYPPALAKYLVLYIYRKQPCSLNVYNILYWRMEYIAAWSE
jgi:hypothetical protein